MNTSGPTAGISRHRHLTGHRIIAWSTGRRRLLLAAQPAGFSLLEILIVMGLIAFLTAAVVAVLPRVQNAAKIAATKATIKKADEMLNDRINGFHRWVQTQDTQAGAGTPSYVLQQNTLNAQPGISLAAAKILAVKQLFQANFPQNYSEIVPSSPLGAAIQAAYPQLLVNPNLSDVAASAECLYLILTKGPLFDTEPPSAADLRALETADTNGDGIPEIVDAWGHPVRFYRWSTRLVRPAPNQSSLGNSGPIDEIYQASGTPQPPPVTIAPTPLMLAMGGAAPRVSLPVWAASTSYSVGSSIVSGVTYPNTGFSLTYQCTAIAPTNNPPASAPSASTAPSWPTSNPVVGATLSDGNSPNNLTWQAFLDPLSVDPDDPNGIVAAGLISESSQASQQSGVGTPSVYATPNTWNVPLIISPGPDETLGLYEPYDNANFGNLSQPQFDTTDATGFLRSAMYDNITNHQK